MRSVFYWTKEFIQKQTKTEKAITLADTSIKYVFGTEVASICLKCVIGDDNCYFRCISKYLFGIEVCYRRRYLLFPLHQQALVWNRSMLYDTVIAISAALASICLEQMYVIGDGNCYFRCISKHLFGTEVCYMRR